MENFYLALVLAGSIFSALYCLIVWFVPREHLAFHRMVISALLVLMKIGEIIFCVILDKNFTSAVIFVFLFGLILIVNLLEFILTKKKNNKEVKED